MHRRPAHSKRNNRLNVLIAGSGGCGKSTLINASCGGHEVASASEWLDIPAQQAAQPRALKLRTYTEDMADSELGSVTFRMVETQGLGDNSNNTQHIDSIVKYSQGQFDEVLAEESRIKRNPRFTDSRVHAVVYMIEATGHGSREQDVEFMTRISSVANVIPVLAKADALTPAEILTNKRLVYEDIEQYKIPIYQFYNDATRFTGSSKSLADQFDADEEQDENYSAMRKLQESLPSAIVASSKTVQMGKTGQHALVRQYPWGIVNIEDPKVSEFSVSRDISSYTHMEDLKETTNDVLYERYRTERSSEDPNFNAAVSAASAPITASRANSASVAQQGGAPGPNLAYPRQVSAASYGSGSRTVSNSSGHSQEYVSREDRSREEEESLHRDEKSVQSELELRRQESRRRELESKRLEEKSRQDSQSSQEQQSTQ